MERLIALLTELKQVTLIDISTLPECNQHNVVEHLEQLQDELNTALMHNSFHHNIEPASVKT